MKHILQFLLLVAFCNCFSLEMAAQNAPKVSVQGTLKTSIGTAVENGTYSIKFKLYDVATGGTALWSQTADVQITGGVYSYLLGSDPANPLEESDFGNVLYLGVTPESGAELSPRTEMTYAPYALSVSSIAKNGGSASFDANGNLKTNKALAVFTGAENPNGVDLAIGDGDSGIDQFADGKLAIRTQGTTRMTFLDNGKVGVGSFNDAVNTLSIGDADTGIDNFGDGKLAFIANGETHMCFNGNGKTGVGNFNNPAIRLAIGDNDTGIQSYGDGEIGFVTNGGERMRIKPGGEIGIGTNNPWTSLHVAGGLSTINSNDVNSFKWDLQIGAGLSGCNSNCSFSDVVALFDGSIVATQAIASFNNPTQSDARIKNIIGVSDAKADLALLQQIKITDYTYQDAVSHPEISKKVIAQDVEAVYPQAISFINSIIPNIYAPAAKVQANNGVLTLSLNKKHELTKGDYVDIKTPHGDISRVEVVDIADDNTFSVKTDKVTETAFVYGKYVDDFRVVDYNALSMLNISATQEMHRQIQQLQQENAALRNENGALRTQSASIENRLSKVEALLNGDQSIGKR
jgi:hypothetical protein